MNLTNDYYSFPSVVGKDICDKIISYADGKFYGASIDRNDPPTKIERIEGQIPDYWLNKNHRDSKIFFIEEQKREIYDIIWPYLTEANERAGWKFDIKHAESPQLTKYEEGGFYNWHRDGKSDSLSVNKKELFGYVRKLSISVNLNEGYEGGQLELAQLDRGEIRIMEPNSSIGTITIFPSFLMHRVRPVTKGKRYSLVLWFSGPPFK